MAFTFEKYFFKVLIFILTMNWGYFRSVLLLFKKVEKRQAAIGRQAVIQTALEGRGAPP